jgi:sarcosine oxidase
MSSFAADGYTPLADRAFALWRDLEAESGQSLLRMTGEVWLLDLDAHPNYRVGVARSLERGMRVSLSERDLAERFPGFRLHDGVLAFYEAEAGYLRSELGIMTAVEQAQRYGATIRAGEEVVAWEADGNGVRVDTHQGSYRSDRVIVTTGPWAAELLADLELPMHVERRVNGFFQPERRDVWSLEHGAPDFLLDVREGSFYGMPEIDGIGLKIGFSGGESTTARTIRRTVDDAEIDFLRGVLDRYMPGASGPEVKRITCMCTYTVDRDFIIDRHPEHSQVIFACGFSGRGYKFAPVVGEILADLAILNATRHDIEFLSASRFAAPVGVD